MTESTKLRKIRPAFTGFDGFTLKIIAVITMIIDHTGVAIVSHLPGYDDKESLIYALYWICRLIGRIAFPLYLFMLVEGFEHTRNKANYMLRLFLFCFLSELPFDLALRGTLFDFKHQNVFFTLLLGFLVMWGFTQARETLADKLPQLPVKLAGVILSTAYFSYRAVKFMKKSTSISISIYIWYVIFAIVALFFVISLIQFAVKRGGDREGLVICLDLVLVSAGMLAADLLHTDYNSVGVLAVVAMYIYRKDQYRKITSGCIILTALSSATELVSFATIPMVLNYNGKRGPGLKYFFYIVYPAHLLILYGLARYFNLLTIS